jgi:hypothetical protein
MPAPRPPRDVAPASGDDGSEHEHDDDRDHRDDEPEWIADNDSPWKDLIDAEFEDFLRFFAPRAAADVDWSHRPVSLDTELQALSVDAELGRRYADKLVRVRRKGGDDVFVLVHVEVQGRPDPRFAARMAGYRRRIESRWDRPVFSMAVLADDSPRWRPKAYRDALWGNRVHFIFHVVKLLDFAPRAAALLRDDNVFALAVVAHLRARASRRQPRLRLRWKLELTRLLHERGHPTERIQRLFRFIDWLLILPAALRVRYTDEVRRIHEERRMPYISTVERDNIADAARRAREQALREGRQEGRQEGQAATLVRLLERRLGALDESERAAVLALPGVRLDALADVILDLRNPDDLRAWLVRS